MEWENVPEWLKLVIAGALSSLGTIVAGYFVARSDSKRVRADDRIQFTSQALERLAAVEHQMQEERQYCEQRMNSMRDDYELRLQKRDEIISELRARDNDRERRLSEIERILQGLEP